MSLFVIKSPWLRKTWGLLGLILVALVFPFGLLGSGEILGHGTPASGKLYIPPIPQDLDQVDLYLLTAGVGEEIANRFGHTGIRILDRRTGSDVVFNWGKFSFDSPGFAWKFFRGALDYSMGVRTFKADLEIYAESGRRLVMDRLNLTARQKLDLISRIRWNAQPENRHFPYQYWYRNCATIPRDYLNDILHGQIAAYLGERPAGKVYRDYVRSNLALIPFLVPWLDVLMNGNIDHEISLWQDMFLPRRLREILREMPAVTDDGVISPASKLLVEETVLVNMPEPMERALPDYTILIVPVWLSLAAALAGYGLSLIPMSRGQDKPALGKSMTIKALGVGAFYWGLVSGITGLTLALNWAFSGHPDGWANLNLVFLWPLDVALIPLGWALFKKGHSLKDRWPFPGAWTTYSLAKVTGVGCLLGLYSAGVIRQDISRSVAYFGSTSMALCLGLWVFAFVRQAGQQASRRAQTTDRVLPSPGSVRSVP